MIRLTCAVLILACFAPVAGAQPTIQPLSPGIVPGNQYGPGLPFIPAAPIPQNATTNEVFFPVALPWGWGLGVAYRTYNPWTGYGYAFGGVLPAGAAVAPTTVIVENPPAVVRQPATGVVPLAEEFPASLSVQIPASGDFWLDGKKVDKSGQSVVLTSPVLRQGQNYNFLVKARWSRGGKTYEAKRSVTLGPGESGRLMILSGDEARD